MSREMRSVEEMTEILASEKVNGGGYSRRLYKQQSDEHKGEQLQLDIANKTEVLRATASRKKVDFSNLQQVQERTFAYMEACERSGTFPSVMGLAVHGYGVSRQALNQYLLTHDNATSEFIALVKDTFADILTNASLYNNANAIQAIFQLKNHFGHSDKVEIVPATASQSDQNYDPDEIRHRYMLDVVETDGDS